MSTPHARNIVRKLLAGGQSLRIQEIYKRGLEQFPATPFPEPPPPKRFPGKNHTLKPAPPQPPNPRHPFRSRTYLKQIVLPDLAASGEVEKFHTVVKNAGEIETRKRSTKSRQAMETGGQDVWLWRLIGSQEKEGSLKLEDEPEVNDVDWYLGNQIYPHTEDPKIPMSRRDPYGAGPLDHLNRRRQNARPAKISLELEWTESVAAARAEGTGGAKPQ